MNDNHQLEKEYNRLLTWAGPRGLMQLPDMKTLFIYHDDPNITSEDKLRLSVCISVPPETRVDGEIGKMEVEQVKYVAARFNIGITEFQQAWDWVYGKWLPASGYQPADGPCFEMYPEPMKADKFTVDICVPLIPL
jgi:AraC family transcriptional regulator